MDGELQFWKLKMNSILSNRQNNSSMLIIMVDIFWVDQLTNWLHQMLE